MKNIQYILSSLIMLIVLSIPLPRQTYAQAIPDCTEAKLRDLGVAIVSCTDTPLGSTCGGGTLVGNDNSEKVFNYFVTKGYQPFQAAGIVGNMSVESGVQPQRLQGTGSGVITPAADVGSTSLGWGLVQWTPGSKMISPVLATIDPATNKPKDPNDILVQLDFLWNQLEGNPPLSEKTAGDDLKATTNVQDAVLAFQGNTRVGGIYTGFERPADQAGSVAERTSFAISALEQFGSGTSSTGNGTGCQLDASGCPTAPISESETVTVAGGIKVHPCIAPEVERIVTLAKSSGLDTFGGSGWVSTEGQEAKRENNGCAGKVYDESCIGSPQTALPGTSRHERGTAVDFTCDGTIFSSKTHPCYIFLNDNTSLKNLPSEEWHWSIDGG